ncbi:unnamed protein product [Acanthoscelides obtectus]|uniref:Uncharacterized protein n=1 Tax=Acanthoscelides obtectus TaxID=200917 RepID=A0A9P0KPN0_ACAOB|nr:unnamed protein product [Acanthoscelides obtectus]CAK1675563.1 hypothetical protein AOBTE_LOCUS30302 [Acanthoscelides obtectus]
MSTLTPTSQH